MPTSQQVTDLQAAVAAEDTVIASAVTAFQGLATMIANVAGDAAATTALAADVRAQAATLAAAIPQNTPAAPAGNAP